MSTDIELTCQRCKLPLQVDTSLLDLSVAQRNLLIDSCINYLPKNNNAIPNKNVNAQQTKNLNESQEKDSVAAGSYMLVNSSSASDNTDTRIEESINDVPNSDLSPSTNASHSMKTLSNHVDTVNKLFKVLSSNCSLEQPICQDCCDKMMQILKDQYEDAIKERDTYKKFLNQLDEQKNGRKILNSKSSGEEEKQVTKQKDELLRQLLALEDEETQLDNEILKLENELKDKKFKNELKLKEQNLEDLKSFQMSNEVQSLKMQYQAAVKTLDKLRNMNIYNETFKISHEGPFGTINGLRLGGFEEQPVSWQEISAAVGQVILLLTTISTRINLRIEGYRLQPMGSYSKILKYDLETQDWVSYEAYQDEKFKMGTLFRKETNFDKALEALLEIIRQLAVQLSIKQHSNMANEEGRNDQNARDNQIHEGQEIDLPYVMAKDKINGISVKLYSSQPSLEWTTAMKLILTNVKWLLVYSSAYLNQVSK